MDEWTSEQDDRPSNILPPGEEGGVCRCVMKKEKE